MRHVVDEITCVKHLIQSIWYLNVKIHSGREKHQKVLIDHKLHIGQM